jgi:UDP-2-acetamido-3-amino-2,3-dideoxy-glucuronate N-acetyltransferase
MTNLTSTLYDTPPGIAAIGSGYWGKNLVRNHYRLGSLKIICDKSEAILTEFKEQYPEVETCLALHEVLPREDIQGVVIATPAETHFRLAWEALMAGKHVYVEKPLALDEREARALVTLAKERQRVLMVGHLLQYHNVFVRLKEIVKAGELGRINYIYSHRLNLGKIRREENILWSFAPHDISMILALAGEEPENVFATGGNYLHRKIADVTTTHLEFPSGLQAHIFVSWLHPFKVQQLIIMGERKMAVFDDTRPWQDKLLLYPHEIRWEDNIPIPVKAEPERLDIPESEPLYRECQCFLESISNGRKPITDGQEGLRVLKVLNEAQRSLNEQANKISIQQQPEPETASDKESVNYFVHPTAEVDQNVQIGKETKIWHFCHVLSGSRIGERCNIGQNVVIGPDVKIGEECKIQNNVSVYAGVTLEEGVFCGPSMVFTNVFNPRSHIRRMDELRTTLVKKGATLGANCTIVCGNVIGRYAFIGAGAVVTRNVPDHALVIGNPARITGWMCECGEKLNSDYSCPVCNKCYPLLKRLQRAKIKFEEKAK